MMARFNMAIGKILDHEGGYVNDPKDRGGETKYGISKKSYPHLDIETLTEEQAKEIYKRDYWDRYDYGRFFYQLVAEKVFDYTVNMGGRQSHKLLQRAVLANGTPIKIDGLLGPKTFMEVNRLTSGELLPAYRSEAAGFYRFIVAQNPSLKRFLKGWLNRAYS